MGEHVPWQHVPAATAVHKAAVVMSFIGCTAWNRTIGDVATSTAAAAPAIGPARCRAITKVHHTRIAADSGVTRKTPSTPIQRNGAINSENPGAHTGDANAGRTGEGIKPAGANVSVAFGHGARAANGKYGCKEPRANASAISA